MATRITVTRRHGSKEWSIAVPPDATLREHRAFLKKLRHAREHPDIAEVMFFSPVRTFRCAKPKRAHASAIDALPASASSEPSPEPAAKAADEPEQPKARRGRKPAAARGLAARLLAKQPFVDTGA